MFSFTTINKRTGKRPLDCTSESATLEAKQSLFINLYKNALDLQMGGQIHRAIASYRILTEALEKICSEILERAEDNSQMLASFTKLSHLSFKHLGDAYTSTQNHHDAISAYYSALHIDDSDFNLWFALYTQLRTAKRYTHALNALQKITMLNPDSMLPFIKITEVYFLLSDPAQCANAIGYCIATGTAKSICALIAHHLLTEPAFDPKSVSPAQLRTLKEISAFINSNPARSAKAQTAFQNLLQERHAFQKIAFNTATIDLHLPVKKMLSAHFDHLNPAFPHQDAHTQPDLSTDTSPAISHNDLLESPSKYDFMIRWFKKTIQASFSLDLTASLLSSLLNKNSCTYPLFDQPTPPIDPVNLENDDSFLFNRISCARNAFVYYFYNDQLHLLPEVINENVQLLSNGAASSNAAKPNEDNTLKEAQGAADTSSIRHTLMSTRNIQKTLLNKDLKLILENPVEIENFLGPTFSTIALSLINHAHSDFKSQFSDRIIKKKSFLRMKRQFPHLERKIADKEPIIKPLSEKGIPHVLNCIILSITEFKRTSHQLLLPQALINIEIYFTLMIYMSQHGVLSFDHAVHISLSNCKYILDQCYYGFSVSSIIDTAFATRSPTCDHHTRETKSLLIYLELSLTCIELDFDKYLRTNRPVEKFLIPQRDLSLIESCLTLVQNESDGASLISLWKTSDQKDYLCFMIRASFLLASYYSLTLNQNTEPSQRSYYYHRIEKSILYYTLCASLLAPQHEPDDARYLLSSKTKQQDSQLVLFLRHLTNLSMSAIFIDRVSNLLDLVNSRLQFELIRQSHLESNYSFVIDCADSFLQSATENQFLQKITLDQLWDLLQMHIHAQNALALHNEAQSGLTPMVADEPRILYSLILLASHDMLSTGPESSNLLCEKLLFIINQMNRSANRAMVHSHPSLNCILTILIQFFMFLSIINADQFVKVAQSHNLQIVQKSFLIQLSTLLQFFYDQFLNILESMPTNTISAFVQNYIDPYLLVFSNDQLFRLKTSLLSKHNLPSNYLEIKGLFPTADKENVSPEYFLRKSTLFLIEHIIQTDCNNYPKTYLLELKLNYLCSAHDTIEYFVGCPSYQPIFETGSDTSGNSANFLVDCTPFHLHTKRALLSIYLQLADLKKLTHKNAREQNIGILPDLDKQNVNTLLKRAIEESLKYFYCLYGYTPCKTSPQSIKTLYHLSKIGYSPTTAMQLQPFPCPKTLISSPDRANISNDSDSVLATTHKWPIPMQHDQIIEFFQLFIAYFKEISMASSSNRSAYLNQNTLNCFELFKQRFPAPVLSTPKFLSSFSPDVLYMLVQGKIDGLLKAQSEIDHQRDTQRALNMLDARSRLRSLMFSKSFSQLMDFLNGTLKSLCLMPLEMYYDEKDSQFEVHRNFFYNYAVFTEVYFEVAEHIKKTNLQIYKPAINNANTIPASASGDGMSSHECADVAISELSEGTQAYFSVDVAKESAILSDIRDCFQMDSSFFNDRLVSVLNLYYYDVIFNPNLLRSWLRIINYHYEFIYPFLDSLTTAAPNTAQKIHIGGSAIRIIGAFQYCLSVCQHAPDGIDLAFEYSSFVYICRTALKDLLLSIYEDIFEAPFDSFVPSLSSCLPYLNKYVSNIDKDDWEYHYLISKILDKEASTQSLYIDWPLDAVGLENKQSLFTAIQGINDSAVALRQDSKKLACVEPIYFILKQIYRELFYAKNILVDIKSQATHLLMVLNRYFCTLTVIKMPRDETEHLISLLTDLVRPDRSFDASFDHVEEKGTVKYAMNFVAKQLQQSLRQIVHLNTYFQKAYFLSAMLSYYYYEDKEECRSILAKLFYLDDKTHLWNIWALDANGAYKKSDELYTCEISLFQRHWKLFDLSYKYTRWFLKVLVETDCVKLSCLLTFKICRFYNNHRLTNFLNLRFSDLNDLVEKCICKLRNRVMALIQDDHYDIRVFILIQASLKLFYEYRNVPFFNAEDVCGKLFDYLLKHIHKAVSSSLQSPLPVVVNSGSNVAQDSSFEAGGGGFLSQYIASNSLFPSFQQSFLGVDPPPAAQLATYFVDTQELLDQVDSSDLPKIRVPTVAQTADLFRGRVDFYKKRNPLININIEEHVIADPNALNTLSGEMAIDFSLLPTIIPKPKPSHSCNGNGNGSKQKEGMESLFSKNSPFTLYIDKLDPVFKLLSQLD